MEANEGDTREMMAYVKESTRDKHHGRNGSSEDAITHSRDVEELFGKSDRAFVDAADLEQPTKNRQFRKFTYRGVDLEQLLAMNQTQVSALLPCRARRALLRGSH